MTARKVLTAISLVLLLAAAGCATKQVGSPDEVSEDLMRIREWLKDHGRREMARLAGQHNLSTRLDDAWGSNEYLAHASRYPQVRSFFAGQAGYTAAVRSMQTSENYFRDLLDQACRETGVQLDQEQIETFVRRHESGRETFLRHFDLMNRFAAAGLDLHDYLLRVENLVHHDRRTEEVSCESADTCNAIMEQLNRARLCQQELAAWMAKPDEEVAKELKAATRAADE